MNAEQRLLKWVYALLLSLYPRAFRDEFSFEMQADFDDALRAAGAHGRFTPVVFFAREVRDVVRAALMERWKENSMDSNPMPRLGRVAVGFAVVPFAVVLLITLPNAFRIYLPPWIAPPLLTFFGMMILIGLTRGLPEWCLPSVGLCFGIAALFSLNFMYPILQPLYRVSKAAWWVTALDEGVLWWGWLAALPGLLLVTALLPPLRSFYRRVCQDWTVLSFAVFGAIPIVLLLTFDEYIGEEWFVAATCAVLISSAYLYLRHHSHTQRVLVLVFGLSLCAGIVIFAKWILLPYQLWGNVPKPPTPDTFGHELVRALAMWGWMMLMIVVLPALFGKLLARFAPMRAA